MKWNLGLCIASVVAVASLSLIGAAAFAAQSDAPSDLPIWAYPIAPAQPADVTPHATAPAEQTLLHVPNSTAPGLTKSQIGDLFFVPDWFPNAHPKMPPIVAVGRKPEVGACGHCHLPTGYGRPENESIAGLPAGYMLEQINDFKNGLRHSSEPRMVSVSNMAMYSKAITPEEAKIAVDYFASIKPVKWIRVVEADTVPKTHPAGGMMVVHKGTEPIGERVIEVSEDYEQTELRNPTSGFVAYVPTGSLKKGEALVRTGGNGETIACVMCHGANLKGVADTPSIAGRSPSQMTRQLIDFQKGSRNGANGQMMKMPVAKLTRADIVAITGYLASLEP